MAKAARALCCAVQLFNFDERVVNPSKFKSLKRLKQFLALQSPFLPCLFSQPEFYVSQLFSFANQLNEHQLGFLASLSDNIFEKLLKEVKSRPSRILNSPRVRNEKSKEYFSVGFFTMAILQIGQTVQERKSEYPTIEIEQEQENMVVSLKQSVKHKSAPES